MYWPSVIVSFAAVLALPQGIGIGGPRPPTTPPSSPRGTGGGTYGPQPLPTPPRSTGGGGSYGPQPLPAAPRTSGNTYGPQPFIGPQPAPGWVSPGARNVGDLANRPPMTFHPSPLPTYPGLPAPTAGARNFASLIPPPNRTPYTFHPYTPPARSPLWVTMNDSLAHQFAPNYAALVPSNLNVTPGVNINVGNGLNSIEFGFTPTEFSVKGDQTILGGIAALGGSGVFDSHGWVKGCIGASSGLGVVHKITGSGAFCLDRNANVTFNAELGYAYGPGAQLGGHKFGVTAGGAALSTDIYLFNFCDCIGECRAPEVRPAPPANSRQQTIRSLP